MEITKVDNSSSDIPRGTMRTDSMPAAASSAVLMRIGAGPAAIEPGAQHHWIPTLCEERVREVALRECCTARRG